MSTDDQIRELVTKAGLVGAATALDLFADTLDEFLLTQNAVRADDAVLSVNDVTRLVRAVRDKTRESL